MEICIDFDGTCTTHDFPKVGKDIGAEIVLKALLSTGHNLILFTMRSDIIKPNSEDKGIHQVGDAYLTHAREWFTKHNIPLYGVQENPTQKSWTHSPKAYGQLYIDDAALGCPLINNPRWSDRPFVDWYAVTGLLHDKGILMSPLAAVVQSHLFRDYNDIYEHHGT